MCVGGTAGLETNDARLVGVEVSCARRAGRSGIAVNRVAQRNGASLHAHGAIARNRISFRSPEWRQSSSLAIQWLGR